MILLVLPFEKRMMKQFLDEEVDEASS